MAEIVCVFRYEKKELFQDVHVLKLDESDKINFVTPNPDLILRSKGNYKFLNLKKGDYAPVRYTKAKSLPRKQGNDVAKLTVYYHGERAKFYCGEHYSGKFQSWLYHQGGKPYLRGGKNVELGVDGPGGNGGPA